MYLFSLGLFNDAFNIALNDRNNDLESMWKEVYVAKCRPISSYFLRKSEENHDFSSVRLVSASGFESTTF